MGSKDKTVSFRVQEDRFEELRALSESMEPSLSQIFRDFVTVFNDHDGAVEAVPAHQFDVGEGADGFPATVTVPTEQVRRHERLELETEHLRAQLDEYRAHAQQLEADVEAAEASREDVVLLEDLDTVSDFEVSVE